jgi:hypothetical protein
MSRQFTKRRNTRTERLPPSVASTLARVRYLCPAMATSVSCLIVQSGCDSTSGRATQVPPPQSANSSHKRTWIRERVNEWIVRRNRRALATRTPRVNTLARPHIESAADAQVSKNSFQVALVDKSERDNLAAQFCSGTLIAPDVIVTAAHCSEISPSKVQILAGAQRLDDESASRVDVEEIKIHPKWESDTALYDLAIWRANKNILSGVVALAGASYSTRAGDVLAMGWYDGAFYTVTLPVIDKEKCGALVETTDRMLCVGGQGLIPLSEGSSGGALMQDGALVGIASWGGGSEGLPGVYTRVSDPEVHDFIVGSLPSARGSGAFLATDGAGRLAALQAHSNWRASWTQIVPGSFGGSGHTDLLLYDAVAGVGVFHTTDGAGNTKPIQEHSNWRTSWTQIIPGDFGGDPYTDLLFYDAAAGFGAFYTTDGAGNITPLQNHADWRTTWTQIVPGNFGGNRYTDLFFYDAEGGLAAVYTTDGNGNVGLLQTLPGLMKSWTQIVAGNFGGDGYTDLLFYDGAAGVGAFYTTDGKGNIVPLKTLREWRKFWTQIVPGDFGGDDHTDLLFYDSAAHLGALYATDGVGNIVPIQLHSDWRKSVKTVVGGNFGGDGHTDLLFYEAPH